MNRIAFQVIKVKRPNGYGVKYENDEQIYRCNCGLNGCNICSIISSHIEGKKRKAAELKAHDEYFKNTWTCNLCATHTMNTETSCALCHAPRGQMTCIVLNAFVTGESVLDQKSGGGSASADMTDGWDGFNSDSKGLILGFYEVDCGQPLALTESGQSFLNDSATDFGDLLVMSSLAQNHGKARPFYRLDEEFTYIALTNLGKKGAKFNELEEVDERRENIRVAIAAGVKQLQEAGVQKIFIDPCSDPEAAAEGAVLLSWSSNELQHKAPPQISVFNKYVKDNASVLSAWDKGVVMAEGQNLARFLMEMPANLMTPTKFCQIAKEKFRFLDKVDIRVRDKSWVEEKQMGAYLSVSRGSEDPVKFVEIEYKGDKDGNAPIALVGIGTTFSSSVLMHPSTSIEKIRTDMGGAACVLSSIYTAARKRLTINIIGLMPLCEKKSSGGATQLGHVLTSMNRKTILVESMNTESQLILSDALYYAETFHPYGIIDLATHSGEMMIALGLFTTGIVTDSKIFWDCVREAGSHTGDSIWRMPLFKHYRRDILNCHLADIRCGGRNQGACSTAAFLKEFVENENWLHMEIPAVSCSSDVPYLHKGTSGRPTRTVVEFLSRILNKTQERIE